jgi:hypothetical protein
MALVNDGFDLYVTLMDSGLNTATLSYALDAVDAATAVTSSATILAALQAIIQAEVKSYAISQRFIEDNLVVPISNVHVENIANVVVQLSSSPLKKANVKIPAPSPSIFVSLTGTGSNHIDTVNADLQTYVDIWRETGGIATLSDGETVDDGLDGIVSGKRVHRHSSRG